MSALRRPLRGRALRLRRPRIGLRGAAICVALLALLAGAFVWVRQSSLVAVHTVTITGVSGPDATEIRSALRSEAHGMTTLDVNSDRLRSAVSAYPVVRGLHVSTDLPHGLTIAVSEQVPVAVVSAGGQRIAVAGDGTLLRQGTGGAVLPTITLAVPPGGATLTGTAGDEVALLGAAPYPLLAKVQSAGTTPNHGLSVSLRNGPDVYFGSPSQYAAKWDALVSVLTSATSAGASYIDVSDPGRPAAGSQSTSDPSPSGDATTGQSPAAAGPETTTSPSSTG